MTSMISAENITKELIDKTGLNPEEIKNRHRSIEIVITNTTKEELFCEKVYFNTGEFLLCPQVVTGSYGKHTVMIVSNKPGVWQGVTGGLRLIMKKNIYIHIGFTRPKVGCDKTFIGMSTNSSPQPVEWAYNQCDNDKDKDATFGAYKLTASIGKANYAGKLFHFTIKD